jgi:hypothetical protein
MTPNIFVDYVDGAQGELLAYFLNSHAELGNHSLLDHNIQELNGAEFKWFNNHSLGCLDWDKNFVQYLHTWMSQPLRAQVLTYHLYKYPHHVDLIKELVPNVHFIKINSAGYENFYKYDYIRKILFRKLNKKNLAEIKFLIPETFKIPIIQLLKQDRLLGIDIILANLGVPSNVHARVKFVQDFLDRVMIPPSNDIVIDYHDWFLDPARTPNAYLELCNKLKICPDPDKLDKLIMRSKINLKELKKFINNFDQLLETL